MTSLRRQREIPVAPRGEDDDLRRMALLLETADVLAARARRTVDPARRAELMRRAGQRRREATGMRDALVARGAALPVTAPARSPDRRTAFSPATPAVRPSRA